MYDIFLLKLYVIFKFISRETRNFFKRKLYVFITRIFFNKVKRSDVIGNPFETSLKTMLYKTSSLIAYVFVLVGSENTLEVNAIEFRRIDTLYCLTSLVSTNLFCMV